MLDALELYGLNRQTLPYVARLLGIYVGSLAPVLYLALLVATFVATHHLGYQPLWLGLLPLFGFERWWTVRHLGRREALVAILLFPEWLYDNYRAMVYWIALGRWIMGTKRVWIPT